MTEPPLSPWTVSVPGANGRNTTVLIPEFFAALQSGETAIRGAAEGWWSSCCCSNVWASMTLLTSTLQTMLLQQRLSYSPHDAQLAAILLRRQLLKCPTNDDGAVIFRDIAGALLEPFLMHHVPPVTRRALADVLVETVAGTAAAADATAAVSLFRHLISHVGPAVGTVLV
jgi:hypothetical protein